MIKRDPSFVLKTRVASDLELETNLEISRRFIETYEGSASYARVLDRLWFGNMGAAVNVAMGQIPRFTGVLNASGSELHSNMSLSDIAKRFGSRTYHKSTWDYRGIALSDIDFMTLEQIANMRRRVTEEHEPKKTFVVGSTLYHTYESNHFTRGSFNVFMMRAADKIENLMSKTGGDILVHCYAGINRSSACVIAYLMIHRRISFQDALLMIEDAAGQRGMMSVFRNEDFANALQTLPSSLEEAEMILRTEMLTVNSMLGFTAEDEKMVYVGESVPYFASGETCWYSGCGNFPKYFCSGCGRAAYCSRDCQIKHWIKDSQSHIR